MRCGRAIYPLRQNKTAALPAAAKMPRRNVDGSAVRRPQRIVVDGKWEPFSSHEKKKRGARGALLLLLVQSAMLMRQDSFLSFSLFIIAYK